MKAEDITKQINEILEGVENSKLGPIAIGEDIRSIPFQTFLHLITNLFPNVIEQKEIKIEMQEPGEDWKK